MPKPQLISPRDYDWWMEFYRTKSFRTARTMASTPHSYLVRYKTITDEEWSRWYGTLVAFGRPGKFNGRPNIYLHEDETNSRWWTMGLIDNAENLILNYSSDGRTYGEQDVPQTWTDSFAPYDAFAAWWDTHHVEVDQSERTALWKSVDRATGSGRVSSLDLGSGTGGSFDAHLVGSDLATVVDPSQGMMNLLYCKHPRTRHLVTATAEEYLSWEISTKFGIALASFGSASHLSPEVIEELPHLARTVVLSFYKPGFRPQIYSQANVEVDDALALEKALKLGKAEQQGNFITVTIPGKSA